jgi:hypothetical protein
MAPKYPNVKVELIGHDGNAYAIIGAVTRAMRKAGLEKEVRDAFIKEATSGDYNKVLETTMKWVDVS